MCSANLGMRFDLPSLVAKSHRRAELVPKKNCILMKLGGPKATAMLFANGKLVCSGAATEEGIKGAARRFTQMIQKMDFPGVNLIDFKIQNVVGTCELGFRVLVEELSFAHSQNCTVRELGGFCVLVVLATYVRVFGGICSQYEPELYPALIYRLEKPSVKILVFVSGRVVFTDSKEPQDLYVACERIVPVRSATIYAVPVAERLTQFFAGLQILRQFKDTKAYDPSDHLHGDRQLDSHLEDDDDDDHHRDDAHHFDD